jgi:NADH dehydrogenase
MILVVGSTGLLGGLITRKLLRKGEPVRILVRQGSPYQALVEAGAQPILGDLKNPTSLAPALAGIDTVITTATAGQRGGEDTIERVDLMGNQSLIDAAAQAGVQRFVFVSTLGSDANSAIPIFRAKGLAEISLRESGMSYTILQPNGYMDIWIPLVVGVPLREERPVVLVGEAIRRHSFVAIQDVAAFALAAADGHPAAHNQAIPIGGPEAVSWQKIVTIVEAALGRVIAVERVAPGEQLPGLPPMVSQIMAAQQTYDSPIDMSAATRAFGITPTPLEAWVGATFVPMLRQEQDLAGAGKR